MSEKSDALRKLSDEDLIIEIEDGKEELFKLRFQHSIEQLENTSRLKEVRRNIARARTILRERQLAAELLQEEDNA
jgi:large subunit ribosomal protein L29